MMGLIGIIIASLVNIFLKSPMMYFVISIGELFMENGFLEHPRKWSVDLSEVEFVSFKQNDENYTYFVKLHIKTKEVRLYLETMEEVEQLIEIWKQYR